MLVLHHKIYLDNDTIKNIAFENVVLLQNEKELNTAIGKNTQITLLIQRKYATTQNKKNVVWM
jgi:hypothetical protein